MQSISMGDIVSQVSQAQPVELNDRCRSIVVNNNYGEAAPPSDITERIASLEAAYSECQCEYGKVDMSV